MSYVDEQRASVSLRRLEPSAESPATPRASVGPVRLPAAIATALAPAFPLKQEGRG